MKFNTHQEKPLAAEGCFLHRNPAIPESRQAETGGLGRVSRSIANIVVVPVLSSERLKTKTTVLNKEDVDELTRTLEILSIGKKEAEKETPKKKSVSPSTKKLLDETPEAFNPSLGRSKHSFVDPQKHEVVEVTRSLRFA